MPRPQSSPRPRLRRALRAAAPALALLALAGSPGARADIVTVVDPPGLSEIDQEIGTLTEAAFEALGAVVNDHENGTGPQISNEPFSIGGVQVTGTYGYALTCQNFSGGRRSFTPSASCPDAASGTWAYTSSLGNRNHVEFHFEPPQGETIAAVGLAFLARRRCCDRELTATVTHADGTMVTDSVVVDGNGDGIGGGRHVFIGFDGGELHGGIVSLQASNGPFTFDGWDDIGVVTRPDLDGDGYADAGDCDDLDGCIHVAALDVPGDEIDSDCDGLDACPCVGTESRGAFMSCVAREAEALLGAGAITEEERDCVVATAARSSCGRSDGAAPPDYSSCFLTGCP